MREEEEVFAAHRTQNLLTQSHLSSSTKQINCMLRALSHSIHKELLATSEVYSSYSLAPPRYLSTITSSVRRILRTSAEAGSPTTSSKSESQLIINTTCSLLYFLRQAPKTLIRHPRHICLRSPYDEPEPPGRVRDAHRCREVRTEWRSERTIGSESDAVPGDESERGAQTNDEAMLRSEQALH